MTKTDFDELCARSAGLLGNDAPLAEGDGHLIAKDEVDVILTFNEDIDSESIACYFDLGRPSDVDRPAFCEHLLELNLRHHRTLGGVYGFESQSGRAIYLQNYEMDPDHPLIPAEFLEWARSVIHAVAPARQALQFPQRARNSLATPDIGSEINPYFA
ncbi:MAG: hypothetical protein EOO22_00625 [Comamonadaceae bacterium]|nr:MAG: hypothetical protein EOO22_00625 [Comamonadaceae bacterium]